MKERPILFSAPMVRALLDNTKTQTRRIVKGPKRADPPDHWSIIGGNFVSWPEDDAVCDPLVCLYGQPGDRLWVRETFYAFGRWETRFNPEKGRDEWHFIDMTLENGLAYRYAADSDEVPHMLGRKEAGTLPMWWKRPAIFMPRWASRITLEIVSVRVERLQDISEADAIAEGVCASGWSPSYSNPDNAGCDESISAVENYSELWEQINGASSWDANPWVWCISFKRLEAA